MAHRRSKAAADQLLGSVLALATGLVLVGQATPARAGFYEVGKVVASDGAATDELGISASISGGTAVVGAYLDDSPLTDAGSVYVSVGGPNGWGQQAKLTAEADATTSDQFGRAVAVSGDTVIVGSSGDDDKASDAGAAYVFTRSGTTWTRQAKLTASDGGFGDVFGSSVALEANSAIIGAPADDDNGGNSGSAYVFVRSGSTWSQLAKVKPPDGAANDHFGESVSVSGDTVVIGAEDDDDKGLSSGSAYVFIRSGPSMTQQAKLTAIDGATSDGFGDAVALDSSTALIGAHGDDDASTDSGSAYVYTRSGNVWSQQAKLTASDGDGFDFFGHSLAVENNTAVVGAWRASFQNVGSGAAYVFARSGTTWTQQRKISSSDGTDSDNFGVSIGLSDGNIVAGANGEDDKGSGAGAAYFFFDDVNPPVTLIDQAMPPVLVAPPFGSATVTGTAADTFAGIAQTRITLTNAIGGSHQFLASCTSGCADGKQISWRFTLPFGAPIMRPGLYRITAHSLDRAGNIESATAQMIVVIV